MAPPKKHAVAAPERQLLPRIGERETNRLAPVFDLAEVKAMLAADAKVEKSGVAEPFIDPDFDGASLPAGLAAATAEWKRAKAVAAAPDHAPPPPCYVVEPTVDPDNPRLLANGLVVPAAAAAAARPLLDWLASCMLLVAEHARAVRDGDFLWQLVYPQTDAGAPQLSEKGRYVVRLFDHGQWRAIVIDDRLPVDADGRVLLPHSRAPCELWPMLVSKALLKLGGRTARGLEAGDASVVAALTGWLPQVLPIAPLAQPEHLIWAELSAALARDGCMVGLALDDDASADAEQVDEAAELRQLDLKRTGLRHGPLLEVKQARSVGERNYVRIHSEAVRWAGKLCDADEASWSAGLDDALEWRRRQRLRKVAAGARLHDFWTEEGTLLDAFSALYIWRDPSAGPWQSQRAWSGLTHVPGRCEALLRVGPPPDAAAALAAEAEEDAVAEDAAAAAAAALHPLLLCLTASPAAGKEEAACWLWLRAHDPDDARAGAALLQLDARRINSVAVALRAGVYRLSVHSATETADADAGFFNFTVHACAALPAAELALADVPTASAAELGRKGARLEGDKAAYGAVEAGAWAVLVRARLTLKAAAPGAAVGKDERGRVPVVAELTPHDDRATAALRLTLVDNESGDATHFHGLRGAARCLPAAPAGYTLLVDAQPGVALERASYSLHVRAPVDADLALEPLQPAVEVEGTYAASYAHTLAGHFVLFRYVIAGAAKSHAAVRAQLSDARAELTVSVYRHEPPQPAAHKDVKDAKGAHGGAAALGAAEPTARTLLQAKAGVGSVVLAAVPLELAEGAKGASGGRVVVEATLAREAAERLGLLRAPRAPPPDPTWPAVPAPARAPGALAPDEPPARALLAFKLSALSDVAVTLAADDEQARALDAQKASWEAKEAGRLARGRASRVAFLVETGALSADEGARMLAEAAPAPAPGKPAKARDAKGEAQKDKGAKGGSQPGSRAQTPADGLAGRATLRSVPVVVPFDAGAVEVLSEQAREAARAATLERAARAKAQREALVEVRAGYAEPRAELIASVAKSHAQWRAAVAEQNERFMQDWEALRLERKPQDDEPPPKPKPGKKK